MSAYRVSARTLRFYEQKELLAPARTELGHRRYSKADCDRMDKIRDGVEMGLTLDQILAALKFEPTRLEVTADQLDKLSARNNDMARKIGRSRELIQKYRSRI